VVRTIALSRPCLVLLWPQTFAIFKFCVVVIVGMGHAVPNTRLTNEIVPLDLMLLRTNVAAPSNNYKQS
jgi:hypothetical protein